MSDPISTTSTSNPVATQESTATKSRPNQKPARGRAGDSDDVRHSKTLSYILRHGAAKEHLVLRPDGFVRVEELMKRPKLKGLTFETLQRIVAENEKQRFTLQQEPTPNSSSDLGSTSGAQNQATGEWWIRANQGHSVQVETLELKAIESVDQVPIMVHGTSSKLWPTIAKQGLSKMSRNHIHCATGLFGSEGVKSGMRANCDLFIFLDVQKLLNDAIPIYRSTNDVLLTPGQDGIISVRYFSKVERKGKNGETEEIDLSSEVRDLTL